MKLMQRLRPKWIHEGTSFPHGVPVELPADTHPLDVETLIGHGFEKVEDEMSDQSPIPMDPCEPEAPAAPEEPSTPRRRGRKE